MSTSSLAWWILGVFIIILVVNQVRNNVRLSNIDKKTVSDNDGALQLGEGAVALAKVLYFVLPVEWVALNVELSSLVVVAAAHHRVHRRLVLGGVRIVRIVHRDDKVIHLFFEHLLPGCILDVAAGSSGPIILLVILLVALGAILHPEVGEPVELLPSWPVLVPHQWLPVKIVVLLLRQYAHGVQKKSEIFFKVSGAKNL